MKGTTITDGIDWSAPTMTVEQACRALGIGRSNGYRAIERKEIPSLRIGGRIVVPTAALKRLLQLDALIAGETTEDQDK